MFYIVYTNNNIYIFLVTIMHMYMYMSYIYIYIHMHTDNGYVMTLKKRPKRPDRVRDSSDIYIYIYIYILIYIYIYICIYIYIYILINTCVGHTCTLESRQNGSLVNGFLRWHPFGINNSLGNDHPDTCFNYRSRSFAIVAITTSIAPAQLDTLQRGVQWIGGAVDGGSII